MSDLYFLEYRHSMRRGCRNRDSLWPVPKFQCATEGMTVNSFKWSESHFASKQYITPLGMVLQNLPIPQKGKKFPLFHGVQQFVSVFTRVHLTTGPYLAPNDKSQAFLFYFFGVNLILSSHLWLGLSSGLLPSAPPTPNQNPICSCSLPRTCPPSSSCCHCNVAYCGLQNMKLLIKQFPPFSSYFFPLWPIIFLSIIFFNVTNVSHSHKSKGTIIVTCFNIFFYCWKVTKRIQPR